MILQTDKRLVPQINEYGCYFMSILFLVNKHTGLQLSPRKINGLYHEIIDRGFMDKNCYINNPQAIFYYLGLHADYTDRHEKADYFTGKNEIEILCFQRTGYRHFMVGNEGVIAFDPMGNSTGGYLLSKRIFKL